MGSTIVTERKAENIIYVVFGHLEATIILDCFLTCQFRFENAKICVNKHTILWDIYITV